MAVVLAVVLVSLSACVMPKTSRKDLGYTPSHPTKKGDRVERKAVPDQCLDQALGTSCRSRGRPSFRSYAGQVGGGNKGEPVVRESVRGLGRSGRVLARRGGATGEGGLNDSAARGAVGRGRGDAETGRLKRQSVVELDRPTSRPKYATRESATKPPKDDKADLFQTEIKRSATLQGYDRFRIIRAVGNGTFGTVFRVIDMETGQMLAVKKVFVDRRYKNRELSIMQELTHTNVIRLLEFFYTTHNERPGEVYLNLVLHFMPDTLYSLVKRVGERKERLSWMEIKIYSFQLLRAIWYLRSLGIGHRDIKPQNVLVDHQTLHLRLADFGSAKKIGGGGDHLAYICSRFYRAPELLLGATRYNEAIDTWSVACVIAEMFMQYPLFVGDNSERQLHAIIKCLGTPTRQELGCLNPTFTAHHKIPTVRALPWASVFRGRANAEAISLLRRMLEYDPSMRIHPMHALTHEFFDDLRHYEELPGNTETLEKILFQWTDEEIRDAGVKVHEIFPPKLMNELHLPF